jgi:zinc/manganese transport system substrate-binding protein
MRRRSLLAALSLAPLAPLAAGAAQPLRVVASFSILGDLARQVGGDAVAVKTLVGPDGDVHVYEPRPKDLRTLMAAGVLVRNGLGLEGWMDRLTGAAGFTGKVVVAADKVTPRTMTEAGGAVATDPHAWQDPRNAIRYVQAIETGLAAADPANGAMYHAAAGRYAARIAEADAWIEARFGSIPAAQRRIITTHDAFGYYGARYGIEFLSAEGISTEFEPSAKAIAALV